MTGPEPASPYLGAFSPPEPTMEETVVRPARSVLARRVLHPDALCGHSGSTILLGSRGPAELVLDFGEERVGDLSLELEASANADLLVRYGETFEEAFADPSTELPWFRFPRDRFDLRPGPARLRSGGRRAFRFVRLLAAGGDLHLSSLSCIQALYPVEFRGSFRCPDPLLNRIYDVAAHTVRLCMHRYYEDGIKRDGLLWIGDARVEALVGYAAFGDRALARRSLQLFAATQREDGSLPACASRAGGHQHPHRIDYMPGVTDGVGRWILDNYCTDFIGMLREYHEATGDDETLAALFPYAERTLDYLAATVRPDAVEPGRFITDENRRAPDTWWASPAVFLSQFAMAADDMARMAARLGREAGVARFRQAGRAIGEVLRSRHLHPETGVYSDFPVGSAEAPSSSLHANAFAVLAGLAASPGEGRLLLERAAGLEDEARPMAGFMAYWVHRAMMESGLVAMALADMRSYYGFMLDRGASTFWEKLVPGRADTILEDALLSRCHGWSGGPAALLPAYVLGIRPLSPGFRSVLVAPDPGGLAWAEGTLPTPQGDVFVHWDASADSDPQRLEGFILLPEGVTGLVRLPGSPGIPGREFRIGPGETRFGPDPERSSP